MAFTFQMGDSISTEVNDELEQYQAQRRFMDEWFRDHPDVAMSTAAAVCGLPSDSFATFRAQYTHPTPTDKTRATWNAFKDIIIPLEANAADRHTICKKTRNKPDDAHFESRRQTVYEWFEKHPEINQSAASKWANFKDPKTFTNFKNGGWFRDDDANEIWECFQQLEKLETADDADSQAQWNALKRRATKRKIAEDDEKDNGLESLLAYLSRNAHMFQSMQLESKSNGQRVVTVEFAPA